MRLCDNNITKLPDDVHLTITLSDGVKTSSKTLTVEHIKGMIEWSNTTTLDNELDEISKQFIKL